MAYIPVGIIAARDEKGNFLPSRPIYIETTNKEVLPSGMTKKQTEDNEDFTEYMSQRYWAYRSAKQKAQRKAELEKKARELNMSDIVFRDDWLVER